MYISSASTVLIWNGIGISDGVIIDPPPQPPRRGCWSLFLPWCALNLFVAVSFVVMVIVVFVIVIVMIVLVV